MNEHDLDAYITGLIDKESAEMLELAKGGAFNGTAKSSEIVGVMAEHIGSDCVSGKDIRED